MSSDSDTHARSRESESIGEIEMDEDDLLRACSEVGDVLRSPRRLRVLNVLAESDGQRIEKADLAHEVARREIGADDPIDVSAREYERVYIGCHQCHLPKLKDEAVIEWDHNHIVPGPEFDRYLNGLHALALSQGLPVEDDLGGVSDE